MTTAMRNLFCRAAAATLVILTATTAAAAANAPEADCPAWDLQQCLDAAREASPLLQAAREETAAAAARLDAARAGRLPVIGVTGSAAYNTETMTMSIPTLPGQPARELEFGDGSTTDLMLGFRAPLYTGGAGAARRDAAAALYQAGRFTFKADSLELDLQVRQTFYAALGTEAAAQAARRGEERLRRHLSEIESNLTAGTADQEARILVLARLTHLEQSTVLAEAEAARLRLALGRLTGHPDQQINPRADLAQTLLPADEQLVPWAQRPLLQSLDARINASSYEARAAAGSLRPTLDVQGGWHYGRPGVDAITNDWMDYGTVAVGLSWTLFDFGERSGRIRGLRAQSRALGHLREDADRSLRTRLADGRIQREAAAAAQDHAQERVDLQRRYLELVAGRLREGFATQREFLDAQDDVTLAEIDLAMSQARLRRAEAELLAALGR